MEKSNYKDLKLFTSYITPQRLDQVIKNDYLPIFIARSIQNSGLIGKWNGTSVHFGQLAPSPGLLREWKKGGLSYEEFSQKFREEQKKVDYEAVLKKISFLCDCSNAKGAILFGYGQDIFQCHRSVVSDIINETGLLNNSVEEI